MTDKKGMTYASTGVDYEAMDPFKRMAQLAARQTDGNISRLGWCVLEMSRGESAFLMDHPRVDGIIAHVEEGLGTKNLVADAMKRLINRCFYAGIGQDTVSMIVNDLATLGALPLSTAMHLAVGHKDWFKDEERHQALVAGWKAACDLAGCVYGPGETPTLRDIILSEASVISGSAVGIIQPKIALITGENIRPGDVILFLLSSGVHANGFTMARDIAATVKDGYLARLSDGRTYGEALLDPTVIYVKAVEACQTAGIPISYAVNITGHGWRKLMRARQLLSYVIEKIPKPQPVFRFMQEHGPVTDEEAYGNLNMGAGYAFFVPEDYARRALQTIRAAGYQAMRAGHIDLPVDNKKRVLIRPKGIEFLGDTLKVR